MAAARTLRDLRKITVLTLCWALLLGAFAPTHAARRHITHEDPDDTAGPLDVRSITWSRTTYHGALHYRHVIEMHDRFDASDVELDFLLNEIDMRIPKGCDDDDCTGQWWGEVVSRGGRLVGWVQETANCDCTAPSTIPVWASGATVTILIPDGLFYPATSSYHLSLETRYTGLLDTDLRLECRIDTCGDLVPDEGSIIFPARNPRRR